MPASKTLGFPFTFYIGIFKYIFLLILLYFWNCHFCLLKINWFASSKNIRISLYFLNRDFQISFSTDFAILLKLSICIENQYKVFHWKSIDFCQVHFLLEIYTQFSIWFTVFKIQIVPLKINWFLSEVFSQWKSIQIFHWSKRFHAFALVYQRYFFIDVAIYLKFLFCIENQLIFQLQKLQDFPLFFI